MEINEKKTKMVAGNTVKLKLVRDAAIGGEIRVPGTIVEVSEEEALELCAPVPGLFSHSGYRLTNQATRAEMHKAVRL